MKGFNWNPVFNLVIKIKNDYVKSFGKIDIVDFERWITRLDKEEYNKVFDHLKVKQFNNFIII